MDLDGIHSDDQPLSIPETHILRNDVKFIFDTYATDTQLHQELVEANQSRRDIEKVMKSNPHISHFLERLPSVPLLVYLDCRKVPRTEMHRNWATLQRNINIQNDTIIRAYTKQLKQLMDDVKSFLIKYNTSEHIA
jgi:hypothetical protein